MAKQKTPLDKDDVCFEIQKLSTADQLYVKGFIDSTLEKKAKDAEAELKLIKEKS